ncbi:hypothetical protein NDU88_000242, partial [Pleurodeles waltl]
LCSSALTRVSTPLSSGQLCSSAFTRVSTSPSWAAELFQIPTLTQDFLNQERVISMAPPR